MLGSRTCLGVDFGSKDLKIVEMRRLGRKYEVLQAARVEIPDGQPTAEKARALHQFLLETGTRPGLIVCSLPANLCSIKFARVPKARPSDMAKLVRFEAQSQIPLPLSEVTWSFAAEPIDDSGPCHVVIAAARKEVAEEILAAMEAEQLRPAAIMVSSLAAAKAASSDDTSGATVVLLDIGAEWMDISLIGQCRVLGTRSIRLGGNDLTRAFAQDLGVDLAEAERLQRMQGIAIDRRVPASLEGYREQSGDLGASSAVEQWLARVADEIRRSIVTFTAAGGERPRKILLIGGLAGLQGIDEAIGSRTDLQVEIGDPWEGMTRSDVCSQTVREPSAAFAVATGLAVSGLDRELSINLMPRYLAEERERRRRQAAVLSGLSIAIASLLFLIVIQGQALRQKTAQLQRIREEVRTVNNDIRRAGPDLRATARAVTQTVKAIENKDTSTLDILRRLSTVLPRGVWLDEFSFETGKSVMLKGGALSNSAVADTVDVLSLLEVFDTITLDYSNQARGESNQGYEFQITCTLPAAEGPVFGKPAGSARERPGLLGGEGGSRTGIVVQ